MIILLMMDKQTILRDIYNNPVREIVECNIRDLFKEQSNIHEALRYTLCLDDEVLKLTFEYNKRMRPFLIWLWSKAAELKQDNIFWELATVVELIHQSTLPADDIQDNSDIRCWRDALWKKAWINTTIDLILLLAASGPTYYAKTLRKDKDGRLHDYSDFLQSTLNYLISWQELDLKADKRWRSIEKNYFEIADGKTWALINLALHFWTMPYDSLYSTEKSKALTKFSMIFARLYQIMDDVKDIKDVEVWEEWAKLDSSNIYYYVDQKTEKLNDLWKILCKVLFNSHNELKGLWIVKNDGILNVVNILIPENII